MKIGILHIEGGGGKLLIFLTLLHFNLSHISQVMDYSVWIPIWLVKYVNAVHSTYSHDAWPINVNKQQKSGATDMILNS